MLGAQQECQARGYELLESHANSQLDAQLSEVQTWIAEGVGAVVCLPLDNNAIIPLIHQAHSKGVKFLDYSDNALPGVDGWVIFDNLQGAKLVGDYAGQWVNQNLGGKAEVALLTHQIQLTGKQRIEGSVAALQSVAPGAKVVAQHEGVLSPDTFPAFQSMLQAHPNINVAICIADEGCAGVEQAFLGTPPSAEGIKDMVICGFDGSGPVIRTSRQAARSGRPARRTPSPSARLHTAAANAIEGKSPPRSISRTCWHVPDKTVNQKLLAELNSSGTGERDSRETPPDEHRHLWEGNRMDARPLRHGSAARTRLSSRSRCGGWPRRRAAGCSSRCPAVAVLQRGHGQLLHAQQHSGGPRADIGPRHRRRARRHAARLREPDLSVGSVGGLAAACFGSSTRSSAGPSGWPRWAAAVGAAWGTMNGILISYLGFSPVIVTLGGSRAR
jgi:hypothetical protein